MAYSRPTSFDFHVIVTVIGVFQKYVITIVTQATVILFGSTCARFTPVLSCMLIVFQVPFQPNTWNDGIMAVRMHGRVTRILQIGMSQLLRFMPALGRITECRQYTSWY